MTSKTYITNYSPFGVLLQNRNFTSVGYRYGFNGLEKDDEIKGEGNSYTTEFRQYDPRLGRWLTLDPLVFKYPWQSPYCAMDNNPIFKTDPTGQGTDEPKKDVVKKNEGAYQVAQRNKITMDQLAKWNPEVFPQGLKSGTYMLHPGQQLNVSDPSNALEEKPDPSNAKNVKNTQQDMKVKEAGYIPPPKVLPGFPDAKKDKWTKGGRPRWKNPDGDILEWDRQHGEVERYDPKGKHKGVYDPETGEKIKDPVPGRRTEPILVPPDPNEVYRPVMPKSPIPDIKPPTPAQTVTVGAVLIIIGMILLSPIGI